MRKKDADIIKQRMFQKSLRETSENVDIQDGAIMELAEVLSIQDGAIMELAEMLSAIVEGVGNVG